MSVWDDFGKLNRLNIGCKTDFGIRGSVIICGNGKNQVVISIEVDMTDKEGKPLIVPDDELLKAVYLVGYEDGKRLNFQGNNDNYPPWYYTDENFGYNQVLQARVSKRELPGVPAGQEAVFYLAATQETQKYMKKKYMKISAGIDIPGVGDFNTSIKGTETKNGPGGTLGEVFKSPDFVEARAVYPDEQFTHVDKTSSVSKSRSVIKKINDIEFEIIYPSENKNSRFSVSPGFTYINDYNMKSTNTYSFKSVDFPRNCADIDTVQFQDNILPDMIIGRGGEEFSAYFVFIQREKSGIENNSYFYIGPPYGNFTYKYRIKASNRAFTESALIIDINQFTVNLSETRKLNFYDHYENIIIDAIDVFGNTYQVKIDVDYFSTDLFFVR